MLPAKLRYSRRVWGGVAVEGWSMPVPGMSGSMPRWARGGRFCMQPGPGRGRDSERRLPGQSCRSGGGLHHSGDNYCTTGYGHKETFPRSRGTFQMPHIRTYNTKQNGGPKAASLIYCFMVRSTMAPEAVDAAPCRYSDLTC